MAFRETAGSEKGRLFSQATYPVDVIWVKSHVDSFLDLTFLLVRISINKTRPHFRSDTGLSRGRVQRVRASRISLKFLKHGCPRSKKNDRRAIQQRTAVGTATPRKNGTMGG